MNWQCSGTATPSYIKSRIITKEWVRRPKEPVHSLTARLKRSYITQAQKRLFLWDLPKQSAESGAPRERAPDDPRVVSRTTHCQSPSLYSCLEDYGLPLYGQG